jgi:hypothetical protein
MTARLALIIATSQYQDSALRQLVAPAQDAAALARVLENPMIGGFQVRTLINETSSKVNLEIEDFCDNRNRDDLLLLYFSGHGIKDTDGQLYFATADTQLVRHNVRRATAVAASFVNQVMSHSRSRRQILLLDCCYSGAFKEGMLAKADARVGVGEQLEGKGRVVLTASDALQYSFEGEQVRGEGIRSIFTRRLVHGLESGEADLDRDGAYSLDELYDYVYSRVSDDQPDQKPMKMGYVEGKIFIGNNPRPRPAEFPAELRESLEDRRPWVRKGAVQELEKLLVGNNKGLILAARAALTILVNSDDSYEIRQMAEKSLSASIDAQGSQPNATESSWPKAEKDAHEHHELNNEPLADEQKVIEHARGDHKEPEPPKLADSGPHEMLNGLNSVARKERDVGTLQKEQFAARHEFGELIGVHSRPLEWSKMLLFVISYCAELLVLPQVALLVRARPQVWIVHLVGAICILVAFGKFRTTFAAIAAASIANGLLFYGLVATELPYGITNSNTTLLVSQGLSGTLLCFFFLGGICVALKTTRNLYLGFTWGALVGTAFGAVAVYLVRWAFGYPLRLAVFGTLQLIQVTVFCIIFLVGWRVLEKRRLARDSSR